MKNGMSPLEMKLYRFVEGVGLNVDVPIDKMYAELYGDERNDVRQRQQYVGAFVTRINKKIAPKRIVPGELKRTYRLTIIKK